MQKQPSCIKGCGLKKPEDVKGSGHEMGAMMLMIVNFITV